MMATDPLIDDGDSLTGARSRFGNAIKVWDDGFGPLWVFRDTMGIVGIVRAQTWEDAWECAEDELLTPIAPEDVPEAYGCDTQAELDAMCKDGDGPELQEGYSYQSNSTGTGIVAHDLNGEALDRLTPELLERLEITLEIERDER